MKIKDFVYNIPMYIGVTIVKVGEKVMKLGDKFIGISYKLHINSDTETGKYLKKVEAQVKQTMRAFQEQMESHVQQTKQTVDDKSMYKQDKEAKVVTLRGKDGKSKGKD